MTEQEFYELCKTHDLTYMHSDAKQYYRGRDEMLRIRQAAATLPRATAVEVWNRVVDEKLVTTARDGFYWTV